MKQHEAVIATMEKLGGIATLGHLYQEVFKIKDCQWNTKTPFASIRRIVQENKEIYKIEPGLYALVKNKKEFTSQGILSHDGTIKNETYNHAYYQGLLLEIGRMKGMETYVPPQDKNKGYLQQKLGEIADTSTIPRFTYLNLVERAKTIDVIWFNARKMPSSMFEVEHTIDIQNSLLKFCDLQDFHTEFFIVASDKRKKEFLKKLNDYSAFKDIQKRVKFRDYQTVSDLHSKYSELTAIEKRCLYE